MTVKELRDKLATMPDQNAPVNIIREQVPRPIEDVCDGGTVFGVILAIGKLRSYYGEAE